MPGPASEYVAARTVLLDALAALGSQCEAIIVVGAQAVYLRTGDAGITGVAPYTTDADLVLAPARLADEPHIETLLRNAAFEQKATPASGGRQSTSQASRPVSRSTSWSLSGMHLPVGAEAFVDRIADKDAADVYRLMLTVPVNEVLFRLRPMLADETAGPVCRERLT